MMYVEYRYIRELLLDEFCLVLHRNEQEKRTVIDHLCLF